MNIIQNISCGKSKTGKKRLSQISAPTGTWYLFKHVANNPWLQTLAECSTFEYHTITATLHFKKRACDRSEVGGSFLSDWRLKRQRNGLRHGNPAVPFLPQCTNADPVRVSHAGLLLRASATSQSGPATPFPTTPPSSGRTCPLNRFARRASRRIAVPDPKGTLFRRMRAPYYLYPLNFVKSCVLPAAIRDSSK